MPHSGFSPASPAVTGSVVGTITSVASGTTTAVTNPRVARAVHMDNGSGGLQPLSASGLYSNQAAYAVPDGARTIAFYVKYSFGGSGGYPKVKCLFGNGTEEGPAPTVDPSITAASTVNGQQNVYTSELLLIGLTGLLTSSLVLPYSVTPGYTTARLLIAENGNTSLPGSASIALTAGYQ